LLPALAQLLYANRAEFEHLKFDLKRLAQPDSSDISIFGSFICSYHAGVCYGNYFLRVDFTVLETPVIIRCGLTLRKLSRIAAQNHIFGDPQQRTTKAFSPHCRKSKDFKYMGTVQTSFCELADNSKVRTAVSC
jgi:hypothetical protein